MKINWDYIWGATVGGITIVLMQYIESWMGYLLLASFHIFGAFVADVIKERSDA